MALGPVHGGTAVFAVVGPAATAPPAATAAGAAELVGVAALVVGVATEDVEAAEDSFLLPPKLILMPCFAPKSSASLRLCLAFLRKSISATFECRCGQSRSVLKTQKALEDL